LFTLSKMRRRIQVLF